jgi:putative peptidoglycan lipid II flippase
VLAALAMGALLWLSAPLVLAWSTNPHGVTQGLLVALLIAGGIAIYGLFLGLFGVIRRAEVVNAIRQATGSGLRD